MQQYLELLRDVRSNGERRQTRGELKSTGHRVDTFSVFGRQARFDLSGSHPVVTTKRVPWKAIVHELLWFLRGDTTITYLTDNKVTIWDEWAREGGDIGPGYGKQWRSWPTYDGATIDQIHKVIEDIRTDRFSRRLIVSAWNVAQLADMALPPCHILFQFYVGADDRLSCHMYQRSADIFLGVPFNIASYGLLTCMVAQVTGLKRGELIISFGDLHLYANLIEQADEQLSRQPDPLPRLILNKEIADIDKFTVDDITLEGYEPQAAIRGEVAV
jgi:thymidylate synthase